MIVYDNRDLLFIMLGRSGSVIWTPMVLVPATFSSLLCTLLLSIPNLQDHAVMSPSIGRIYATIIAFVVVFRVGLSFKRFFDGVTHCQEMFSKWRDAFMQLCAFFETSAALHHASHSRHRHEHYEELMASKERLVHWFTLLAAIAVETLKHMDDEDASSGAMWENNVHVNLEAENRIGTVPSAKHGGCRNTRSASTLSTEEDELAAGSSRLSQSGTFSAWWRGSGRSSSSSVPSISSSMGSGTPDRKKTLEAMDEKMRGDFGAKTLVLYRITDDERRTLMHSHDRVLTVVKWILVEISAHSIEGRLLTAPPILSRVYQELSSGMLGFSKAMKIVMVPFPFPFTQVVIYFLFGFYLIAPFVVIEILKGIPDPVEGATPVFGEKIRSCVIPILFNFVCTAGYAALNEIATELEDPFGEDANDYPVHVQQWHIVWAIEDIYFTPMPMTFAYGDTEHLDMSGHLASQAPLPPCVEKKHDSLGAEEEPLSQNELIVAELEKQIRSLIKNLEEVKRVQDDVRKSSEKVVSSKNLSVGLCRSSVSISPP